MVRASMVAEQESQQNEAVTRSDVKCLVEQRRREYDRRAVRGTVTLIAKLGKAQLAALELLEVEVDRHCKAAIRCRLHIIAMAVKLAAALALIAADTQPFPTSDAVLEGLGYLGQQPLLDAIVQQ